MSAERSDIVVCVNDKCQVVDAGNNYLLTWLDLLAEGVPVSWCNKSERAVVIKFDGKTVDRDSITIKPGETATAMVMQDLGSKWHYYKVAWAESDDGGQEEEETAGIRGPSPPKTQEPPPGEDDDDT